MIRWIRQTETNIVELMKTYHIALFLADGIGPTVIASSRQVLAALLMQSIEAVLRPRPVRTRDLGGSSSTIEMTDAVCEVLESEVVKA
jgi:isocitrate/isopropylmalate dehydrogenase